MRPFRILAATLALLLGAQAMPAVAETENHSSGDPIYSIQNPPTYAMIGDLIVARPLLIAATILGTGLFIVASPFAALGGNLKETGNALVVGPAKAAFVRCLGCSGDGYADNANSPDR